MSQVQFREKETGFITLTFVDQDSNSIAPELGTYTLYDKKTKAIINSQDKTPIPNLAASVDLELVPADNPIIDDTLGIEEHVIFVEWVYSTDKKGKQELTFDVINLEKVT